MNYWHMQLHPSDQRGTNTKKLLHHRETIGLGEWEKGEDQIRQFKNELEENDIVLVHDGDYHALLKVIGQSENNKEQDQFYWFHYIRKVEILDEGAVNKIGYNGNWKEKMFLPKTIQKVNNSGYIKFWHQKNLKEKQMQEYINILEHKKQIILQGAPGTGKTYITAEIAMKLINNDKTYSDRKKLMEAYKQAVKNGQIAFTTFHQSLDYEEFVEGYKPTKDANRKLTYEVQDGIFKKICERALGRNNFEESFEKLKGELEEKGSISLETGNGTKFKIIMSARGSIRVAEEEGKYKMMGTLTRQIKKMYFNQEGYYPSYVAPVLEHMKKKGLQDFKTTSENNKEKPYILIIDEINRGNISKILGELITLLEADKRLGEENKIKVTLPYSNEEFGVPENLYIIGTMNTADRSIGYIDYAVRRRFAFITLKAEKEKIEKYKDFDNEETKGKAIKLFEAVEKLVKENIAPDLKGEDLMVGHSYFMAKYEPQLKLQLEYEIRPLLLEYVKDGVLIGENLESTINRLSL